MGFDFKINAISSTKSAYKVVAEAEAMRGPMINTWLKEENKKEREEKNNTQVVDKRARDVTRYDASRLGLMP